MAIKHRTLDALVVDEVRERIISGEMLAGAKIDQQALADELGVSRMPIREALRRLAAEGFVELVSHRGAIVVELSHEEIIEIYEMRAVLQGLASRLAVPNYTEGDIAGIQRTLERMDANGSDLEYWVQLNKIFHERIERPSNKSHILGLVERLTQRCAPYMQIAVQYLRVQHSSVMQTMHHDIFGAVVAGDPDQVETAVRAHLLESGRQVATFVRKRSTGEISAASDE